MYGDSWGYMRENRERRARDSGRTSGEYSSRSYADDDPYTRRAPSSSTYGTEYGGYGSPRSGTRSPPLSDYERESFRKPREYDVPPTPRGRAGARRDSFDDPAYEFDSGYASDTDPLRGRFTGDRKPGSYARRSPSPPPTRRAYDFADDLRSGSSKGPRWVSAMSIEEADEGDPRLKFMRTAPYVYVGTTDPDGTVVDKPSSGAGTPRGSGRYADASSSSHGNERYGSRRDSGRYARGAYEGEGSSGSYTGRSTGTSHGGTSYTGTSSGGSYGGSSSFGASFYGASSRGSSSYGRGSYDDFL
jgi:hypothetical protein